MAKIVPAISENSFQAVLESTGMTCQEVSEKYAIPIRTLYRWSNGQGITSQAHNLLIKNLKEMAKSTSILTSVPKDAFTFIDLFAGIGGFRRAFDSIGGKCIFTSEWDKASRMTYQANYTCDHPFAGDIREYTKDKESLEKIPRHDVLLAGFPCQPFSIAGVSKKNSLGKSHGFKCDTQGTLFFDLAQIIEHHRPSVIVLENVKNLASHDGGKTFGIIKKTLEDELGYNISYRILDGRSWVPQHRERIFIVGLRKDLNITPDLKNLFLPATDTPKLGSILHKKTEEDEYPFTENGKVTTKYTLSQKLWDYLRQYKDKHTAKGNGFGYSLFGINDVARTLSARYYKDGSEILINQGNKNPRRLTPRECSRLMGFDGPLDSNFKIPVSDTQAYRQFGNSVIVPCVTAVAEFIKPYINSAVKYNNSQLQIPFGTGKKERKTA